MQFSGDSNNYRIRLQQHHQRRRHDHHYYQHRHQQEKAIVGFHNLGAPSHSSPEHQPEAAGSLRRQVAALLAQHHRSSDRDHHYHHHHPLSPASYGSSLEMNPYKEAATPTSSIEFKGRIGEPSYSFKTSTELLKVLNRIWTLEEQHASNVSLVKALKTELDHARTRIKDLLRDQQASRHEIDDLMKQVAEDKLVRESKEQERINATIQSLRNELEDERRLRKRSEALHRRLAKEVFEVKVALSTSLKELERERKGHCLLEGLCDEFAKGIIEYERKLHGIRQNTDNGHLMVHICEAWLDERTQMKDQEDTQGFGCVGRDLVVDKLRYKIESFLQTRKMIAPRQDAKNGRLRRNSLESIPLNEAGSAPLYVGNEDSAFSSSHCFETKQLGNSKFDSHENEVGKELSEATAAMDRQGEIQAINSETKTTVEEKPVTAISALQTPDKVGDHREGRGIIDKLMSELLLSEGRGGIVDPGENKCRDVPCNSGNPALRKKATITSPVDKTASPDLDRMESSSKNSLKAKLQEPKTRVGYRSRLKILKGSS